jgi:hypothetical protein
VSACSEPLAWAELVDYAAGDLSVEDLDRVEEHLMGCAGCTLEAGRVLAVTTAIAALPPPVVSAEDVARMRARGLRVVDNVVTASQRTPVTFGADVDILIHHLTGLDLRDTESVHLTALVESTGQIMGEHPDAPFDRSSGELLIACQRHFVIFPPDVLFEVRARQRSGAEVVTRYAVPHILER